MRYFEKRSLKMSTVSKAVAKRMDLLDDITRFLRSKGMVHDNILKMTSPLENRTYNQLDNVAEHLANREKTKFFNTLLKDVSPESTWTHLIKDKIY